MRLARLKPFAGNLAAQRTRSSRLHGLGEFGSNPGDLAAWWYAPPEAAGAIPLVVVLHGCTQTAHGYDLGSGWSALAEEHGFAVLYPEQQRANNPNGCFNWFGPSDTRRGSGEADSIAQMIDTVTARAGIDPARVFITGLSAGGAMASVMLAAYPEKFAGGAIIAGLPFGAATSVQGALQQMRAHTPSSRTSGNAIKSASRHRGPWPVVSIWHGAADTVVSPSNADAIGRQWREVHGLPDAPSESSAIGSHSRRAWLDATGRPLVVDYRVAGMGHGVPLDTASGPGAAGAFMLEAGISSTMHSAREWGLLGDDGADAIAVVQRDRKASAKPAPLASAETVPPSLPTSPPKSPPPPPPSPASSQIGQVIEQALRAAGLMK